MLQSILRELTEIRKYLSLQKKVLTLEEFCAYAGISRSYAYHLTSSNKIKFYRPFGKMIYFDVEEVIEFLKQNNREDKSSLGKKVNNYLLKQIKN